MPTGPVSYQYSAVVDYQRRDHCILYAPGSQALPRRQLAFWEGKMSGRSLDAFGLVLESS